MHRPIARGRAALTLLLVWTLVAAAQPAASEAQGVLDRQAAAAVATAWREPQALNIVDIAGQVPDEVLKDNIVVWDAGGIALFERSERSGSLLHIHVTIYGRRYLSGDDWVTFIPTLGMSPLFDHFYSTVPATQVRVWEGDREITAELSWLSYHEPPTAPPANDAGEWPRYPGHDRSMSLVGVGLEPHGMPVPANTGGTLTLPGDRPLLRAVFTVQAPDAARVTWLGTQQEQFGIMIGPEPPNPGDMGSITPLVRQLNERFAPQHPYGTRHPRIPLQAPPEANYVMFTYPPTPFDIYDSSMHNFDRPIAGTVRLAPDEAMLSQNMNHGGAFPLRVAWQDGDQSSGWFDADGDGPFLDLLPPVDRFTPPEYYIPAGMPYDPCFHQGNCSDAILDRIHDTMMPIQVIYLEVEPRPGQSEAISVRFRDDPRLPDPPVRSIACEPALAAQAPAATHSVRAFLPIIMRPPEAPPPPVLGLPRPLGFLEHSTGRMVGYLP